MSYGNHFNYESEQIELEGFLESVDECTRIKVIKSAIKVDFTAGSQTVLYLLLKTFAENQQQSRYACIIRLIT